MHKSTLNVKTKRKEKNGTTHKKTGIKKSVEQKAGTGTEHKRKATQKLIFSKENESQTQFLVLHWKEEPHNGKGQKDMFNTTRFPGGPPHQY